MTTAHSPSTAGQIRASRYAEKKLKFVGTAGSEFLKYRTLTTNWVMVSITLVVMVGLSAVTAMMLNYYADLISNSGPAPMEANSGGDIDVATMSISSLKNLSAAIGGGGMSMANMLVASIAVVFIASEYSTRSIQTTLTVVPKRSMVYLAKLLVVTLVSFVVGYVGAAISFFVGQLIVDDSIHVSVNSGVLLNWLAIAAYVVFMSWLGLGMGALLRNNAGAIVCIVVLIFISNIVFSLLPWEWSKDFNNYLPIPIGDTFISYGLADDAEIGYGKAGLTLAAWGAVPAILGYLRFRFTDSK